MLKLGVDIIKIDKMFVDAIGTDRNSTTIVETLVDLARNMRMDVVAEGSKISSRLCICVRSACVRRRVTSSHHLCLEARSCSLSKLSTPYSRPDSSSVASSAWLRPLRSNCRRFADMKRGGLRPPS